MVDAANSNVNYAGVGGKRRRSCGCKSSRRRSKSVRRKRSRKRGGFIRSGSVQHFLKARGKLA